MAQLRYFKNVENKQKNTLSSYTKFYLYCTIAFLGFKNELVLEDLFIYYILNKLRKL